MPKNTIISVLAGIGAAILAGMLVTFLVTFLLEGYYWIREDDFFSGPSAAVVADVILSFVAPPIFGLGFLLPLAAIDKKRLESLSRKQLMIRYAPLVTIPPGICVLLILTASFYDDNSRLDLLSATATLFSIGCTSLWFFVRRIRS